MTKNIAMKKTYSIKKVMGVGGQPGFWKKKVSVSLFSTFRTPLEWHFADVWVEIFCEPSWWIQKAMGY